MTSLRDARILITGGAGLIGSHIAELLVAEGAGEILIFDDLSRGRSENLATARAAGKVTLIAGDVRDRAAVAAAVDGVDLLFHLAALRLTQCAAEPRLALEVMADGTFNVVEAAAKARVGRLVAASSSTIYGTAERIPIPEEQHPYGSNTLYGAAKVFGECLLRSFHVMSGLNYVALRPFHVYGPRMDIRGAYREVLVHWMDRIARGLPPIIFGDGAQSMDFVYVGDVARAFVLAARAGVQDDVFNVASGVETTLEQLARALLAAMGSDLEIEHAAERTPGEASRRVADTRKAKVHLGFEARVSLAEGLRELVTWWWQETGASVPVPEGGGR